jgi:hypothetical protein
MSKKPDDAAKIAGLTNILQSSNKPKDTPPAPPKPAAVPSPVATPKAKERVGKYRDPAFKCVGLYIRKETFKRVKRKLEDLEADQDLSDLTEMLYQQWLEKHQ